MSDHVITYDLQYPGNGEMDCHAAPDAPCHAVWDCDCESIHDFHVIDGQPHHYSTYDDGYSVRGHHVGKFENGACTIREWHENSDEDVAGTVRVDVNPVWEGDFFAFHAVAAEVVKEDR